MTKQEVLAELQEFTEDFPTAAFKAVQADRATYTPDLLQAVQHVIQNMEELYENDDACFLFTYAIFLLAEFREKKAFPYLVTALRQPRAHVEFFFGDTLTEDCDRLLFSTYDSENLQLLIDLIEDQAADEWARNAAVSAYSLLCKEGMIAKETAVAQLRAWIYEKLPPDDSEIVFTAISECVIDNALTQMLRDVRYLYDEDRIGPMMYGEYDA
ncbi:MAG: DUF1186 family protein, partial [Clostridiales bacterium]|nr:DUF1186 family protein [Clostridiales bacterium]